MRTDLDVAVVGASAAGLYAALTLAENGVAVGILERTASLRPAPRSLIVTSALSEVLGRSESVVNEIRRFELFANGHVATVPLESPDLVVDRRRLILELAGRAREAGAQLLLGRRFESMRSDGPAIRLYAEGGTPVVARTVVGADGAFSRVARVGGWAPLDTLPLLQARVTLPRDLRLDTARVWFRPLQTPYFFWLIPESETHGVLGLIAERAHAARGALDAFLSEKGLRAEAYEAARVPRYTRWVPVRRRLEGGDVFLVGDAAGHVKVSTVGGIVTGFRGTRAVVGAILGSGSRRELRALRRELNRHRLVRRALSTFDEDDYVRLISALDERTTRTLGAIARDDVTRLLRHMVVRRPSLGLAALRQMLFGGRAAPAS